MDLNFIRWVAGYRQGSPNQYQDTHWLAIGHCRGYQSRREGERVEEREEGIERGREGGRERENEKEKGQGLIYLERCFESLNRGRDRERGTRLSDWGLWGGFWIREWQLGFSNREGFEPRGGVTRVRVTHLDWPTKVSNNRITIRASIRKAASYILNQGAKPCQ